MKIPQRLLEIAILLITVIGTADTGFAQGTAASEYEIKAAFLYNFARFAEWPAKTFSSPSQAIVIGIIGNDPFGAQILQGLKDKKVEGHPLIMRHIDRKEDIAGCQILFVGSSKEEDLRKIFALARENNVLTVGESAGFMAAGGMIRFFLDNEKVRFEVDLQPIDAASIKLSAKLLGVAAQVHRDAGPSR